MKDQNGSIRSVKAVKSEQSLTKSLMTQFKKFKKNQIQGGFVNTVIAYTKKISGI